jgi:uncharacterized iron-regulated membrane protein
MVSWQRWVNRPQALPWRRLLVQVHLWIGLGLGAYVVVMSVTGSAVVLRPQFHQWLIPRSVPMVGERLAEAALDDAVRAAYPTHEVLWVRSPRQPEMPVFVGLQREGVESERLFDPYAAIDLGLAYPPVLHGVEWLVDLHDNLLAGAVGRTVNGFGALLFVTLLATGAVLWWPGRDRWRHSLWPGSLRGPRFARRLHTALGFWSFALLFVWGITAVYFAFPEGFERTIDWFDADQTDAERPGAAVVSTLVRLHFGRFGGMTGRLAWVLLGLVPAILFVTGFITWRATAARGAAAAGQPGRLNR